MKTAYRGRQFLIIQVDKTGDRLSPVLHDPARMRKGYDLLKESMFRVETHELLIIGTLPEAEAGVEGRDRLQLPADRPEYKRLAGFQQFPVIVIIQVLPVLHESQRNDGRNEEIAVKGLHAPVGIDHLIDKLGREFRRLFPIIGDAAWILQSDGIGKGYTRYAAAETARVDPENEDAWPGIGIKFLIEGFRRLPGHLIHIGVHDRYSNRPHATFAIRNSGWRARAGSSHFF